MAPNFTIDLTNHESYLMSEGHRRYPRFTVEGMEVHAKTIFSADIELFNISMGGACIQTPKRMRIGGNYLIRLKSNGSDIPLKCTVIWESLIRNLHNSTEETVPLYQAGLSFQDISSDKLVKLKDFIRVSGIPYEHRLTDEQRLSALRFKIDLHGKGVLNYPKSYKVKRISLGGMLIETNYKFQVEQKLPMALFLSEGSSPIKFLGRIASITATEAANVKNFDTGIEFINISEEGRKRLSKFIFYL